MIRSNPPLQVVGFIGTRKGDAERGPLVRLRSDEAQTRFIGPHDLVWVRGARRSEIAEVQIDDSVPRGGVILRDIAGVGVTEIVHLEKTNPTPPSPAR